MVVTIVLPVSRKDFLHRIFAQLDMMPCDRENTNLLVYVDGDMELFNTARNFVLNSKFKEKLCVPRRKGSPSSNHVKSRRQRIGDIHNEIKEILVGKCDYLFLLEDDTLFQLDTLQKFIHHYQTHPHAGLITGVQVGRWGMTVPGVWHVDNPYNVKKINSMLPNKEKPFEEIDAAGLFCCITKWENYKRGDFKPFDAILGPDVSYGLSLRREGYKNYIDWTIAPAHLTKRGEIRLDNVTLQQITFTNIEPERWEQEVI